MTRVRFSLRPGRWYACQFIGDEFEEETGAYSPIRVDRITPFKTGKGILELGFCHANYPEGVRDKTYRLVLLERGERYLLAKSVQHQPARTLLIYEIDWKWMQRHFNIAPVIGLDIQSWFERPQPFPVSLGTLFEEKPMPWGLRGDPGLWDEMQKALHAVPLPSDVCSLERLLVSTFESLVGSSLNATKDVYIERYDHGGMSSGYVSMEFWRETAIPTLMARGRRAIGQDKNPYS